jgi:hypothetical protein
LRGTEWTANDPEPVFSARKSVRPLVPSDCAALRDMGLSINDIWFLPTVNA